MIDSFNIVDNPPNVGQILREGFLRSFRVGVTIPVILTLPTLLLALFMQREKPRLAILFGGVVALVDCVLLTALLIALTREAWP